MSEKAEILTQREFARRVGVTSGRICQLVKAGRIPVTPEKRVLWPAARELWDALHLGTPVPATPSQRAPSPAAAAHRETVEATDSAIGLQEARTRKEAARARLAELDLAEREGELIPVAEVRMDAVAVLAAVRSALLALPGQMSLRCEGRSAAEIGALLADHVNGLLAEWHQGRFC